MALIPGVDNYLVPMYIMITLLLMISYYFMNYKKGGISLASIMLSWCILSSFAAMMIQKNLFSFSPIENFMGYCICLIILSSSLSCTWSM